MVSSEAGLMVGQAAAPPRQDPSLDVAHTQTIQMREQLQTMHNTMERIEDHLSGATPRSEAAEEPTPSGMMGHLCYTGAVNNELGQHMLKRLALLSQVLGVPNG